MVKLLHNNNNCTSVTTSLYATLFLYRCANGLILPLNKQACNWCHSSPLLTSCIPQLQMHPLATALWPIHLQHGTPPFLTTDNTCYWHCQLTDLLEYLALSHTRQNYNSLFYILSFWVASKYTYYHISTLQWPCWLPPLQGDIWMQCVSRFPEASELHHQKVLPRVLGTRYRILKRTVSIYKQLLEGTLWQLQVSLIGKNYKTSKSMSVTSQAWRRNTWTRVKLRDRNNEVLHGTVLL
jgi:hypothetical protein